MGEALFIFEDDPVVIVEHPTGIRYAGQVGGMLCSHPEVEGFYLKVPGQRYDWGGLADLTHERGCCSRLGREDAPALKAAWPIPRPGTGWWPVLDEDRLHAATECWLPVIFRFQEEGWRSYPELDGRLGWLLLPGNCD